MSSVALLVDVAFAALEAKLERDIILARIREREAAGDTLEQITVFIKNLRDAAIEQSDNVVK